LRNYGSNHRNVFFVVCIDVRDIDLRHHIDGRLSLRMVRWSRLFGQLFRFDEWSLCRG
jgi:hypothetical protein